MGAPVKVLELVERFRADEDYFMSPDFAEMSLRSEFLNPVLRELGWDPDNPGLSAPDREVIQEQSLTMGGRSKAPDYAFRLERQFMFFLEAKRPLVRIQQSRDPALQIRRYCWTAGLPLGLISDFQEWAIYDCRAEPGTRDGPQVGRLDYFTYADLDRKWDELVARFSRDAVAGGSLAEFAAREDSRGTLTVDQTFLNELSRWRENLAKTIARHNTGLDAAALNESVQTLLDRIIFLRIAEARGLEEFGALKECSEGEAIYGGLIGVFRRADDRYNSGLFHFSKSAEQTGEPDDIAPKLVIPNHYLKQIISRLYYPHPYEFSVMPADILGKVYEQFLGSQIVLDDGRAIVDTKPEVRKAGGVYYTPVPVVEYIVQKTLRPLLDGATPGQVAKLRIVDPSCGSGSFLIAAYQHLIDWYTAHYAKTATNRKRYLEGNDILGYRLKTSERKRILLDNVFGVDIDPQAVEVTKLSLLLKVIEGETQLELAVGRILPDLGNNIKCGNSLIDIDFPMPMTPTATESAYNPFSWEEAFPAVFRAGGFDAVIGNPPYLGIDSVWGKGDPRAAYMKTKYPHIHTDKTDILYYFLAKAVAISKGESAFIVSRSFLEADKAKKLRSWLAENSSVREVLDFRDALVFPGVGINTAIVRLTGSRAPRTAQFRRYQSKTLPVGYLASHLDDDGHFTRVPVPLRQLGADSWVPAASSDAGILAKMDAAGEQVGTILHVGQGMQTGANAAFTIPTSNASLLHVARSGGLTRRRARNSDIRRFGIVADGPILLYVEDVRSFNRLPSAVQQHLSDHRAALEARAAFQRGNCDWWRYTWPLHKEYAGRPRILVPYRAKTNRFAVDTEARYLGITDTTILYDNNQPEDLRYIVGVLNSRPLTYRFRFIGKLVGGGTYEYFHNTVAKLPVPRREPGDPVHDRIVRLVEEAEEQQSIVLTTAIPRERADAETALAEVEAQLNDLVATLFGLSVEDITTIEQTVE